MGPSARGFLRLPRWPERSSPAFRRGVAAAALLCAGCGDEATVIDAGGGGAPAGETPAPAPTSSAILLVGQVYSPEAYNTYVGVLPEVPSGEVSFDTFRELGNANASPTPGPVSCV